MSIVADNLSLKAFVVLMKSSKTIQERVKQDIQSYGMKTSEFAILETLFHKGRQTVRQISEAVLINTGSITYVIDKLETKGLLEREHCKEDRRVVYIQITNKGTQLMQEIFPKHQQVIENLFEGVSKEDMRVVIETLKKVGLKA
ncbi:MarR family winged helix-turn-helix transcriptional regulator [Oceanobacillus jordanicus]|uniref:MarR family winged helix-turn-helix transcriptional regulator n=1 Tax=Oceanobacillus jordanicus TaxID=2867266 RepID=UPI002012BEAC|nr:MarR family transcriptional regulator [Oceanobacillus jordanicus]